MSGVEFELEMDGGKLRLAVLFGTWTAALLEISPEELPTHLPWAEINGRIVPEGSEVLWRGPYVEDDEFRLIKPGKGVLKWSDRGKCWYIEEIEPSEWKTEWDTGGAVNRCSFYDPEGPVYRWQDIEPVGTEEVIKRRKSK